MMQEEKWLIVYLRPVRELGPLNVFLMKVFGLSKIEQAIGKIFVKSQPSTIPVADRIAPTSAQAPRLSRLRRSKTTSK